MKTIAFTIILIAMISAPALAVDHMYNANQRTVAWDGDSATTAYEVYLKELGSANVSKVAEVAATQYTFSFAADTQVIVGVKALRRELVDGVPTLVAESQMAWSDVSADCAEGKTFGLYYFIPPGKAKNIR